MSFRKFWKNLITSQIKYGVNKGSELYNSSMKSWLEKNDIKCSVHHKGKSVVAEKFTRTLKN